MKAFTILCLIAAAIAAPTKSAEAAAPKATNSTTPACAQSQASLEKGIQANLDIQAQELKGVQFLQSMIQGSTPQSAMFQVTQQSVLAIQQQGIALQESNQKLAESIKSPAKDGLATVATAQVKEVAQVQGLKGTKADEATLKTLVQEVEDGTKQNQKNLEAAKGQKCAK